MSDQTVTLQAILELKAKTDELRKGQQDLQAFKQNVDSVNDALGSISNGFAQGLGIGGALSALGAVKSVVSEIVGEMKALVVEGVNFNGQMETAQIGIAGALKQFFPERFKTFSDALRGSADVVDLLRKKSIDLGLSFDDSAHIYQVTVGAMFKAGIFDLNQQVELVTKLQRTLASQGVTGARASRDIADIFNGQANRIVAAKALGITNEDVKAATDQGRLFDYLTEKIQGFSEAAVASQESLQGLQARLENTKASVAADATKELTSSYKELLKSLIDLVNSDSFKGLLELLSAAATQAVNIARGVTEAITTNAPNKDYAQRGQTLRSELDNARTPGELESVKRQATVQRSALQKGFDYDNAYFTETTKKTLFGKQLFQSYSDQFKVFDGILADIDKRGKEIIGKNAAADAQTAQQVATAKTREAEEAAGAQLDKNAGKIQILKDKLDLVGLKDEARLAVLKDIVAETNKEYDAKAKAATGPNQVELNEVNRKKELLPVLTQIAATESKITTEKNAQAKRLDTELDKFDKELEQGSARLEIQKARNALNDVDAAKALIANDRFKTRLEKESGIYDLLKKEPALIDDIIAKLKVLSDNTSDQGAKNQIDSEINTLSERRKKNPAEQEKVKPLTTGEDVEANFTGLKDNFATIGSSIAEVTNSAIGSLSQGFQNLFTTSETVGQRIQGVFLGIGQSAIKAVSDMAAQWLIQHTVMAGISAAFHTGETVGHAASEATKTAVTAGATAERVTTRTIEAGTGMALTATDTAAHVTGEVVKTGATVAGESARTGTSLVGALARRGIHLAETIFHGLQVAIRTAVHVAGEIAKTTATIINTPIRIGATIAESTASVVKGAVEAFSAMASIPYVGPFLGAAAMVAALAAGLALVGGIKKNFADGGAAASGYISGPGGPRSDRIPANLSNQEYVLNAQTTSRIGKERLDAMNFGNASPYDVFANSKPSAGSSGGSSGSSGGKSAATTNVTLTPRFVFVDSDREADRINDTEANEAYVLKIMRKNGVL